MSNVSCHMYACPCCKEKTVRFAAKWLSSRVFPAKCSSCLQLCFAPGSPGGTLLVVNALLLTLVGFAAMYWHEPFLLLAGLATALALWFFRLHLQPLLLLSGEEVASARKAEGVSLLLVLLFSAMQ
jgi:hypothetical protein